MEHNMIATPQKWRWSDTSIQLELHKSYFLHSQPYLIGALVVLHTSCSISNLYLSPSSMPNKPRFELSNVF